MISFDDLFYTASLIEFTGRRTLNSRKVIAEAVGAKGFTRLLELACVNHCLSFEQVADELVERYKIQTGTFDTVSECKYQVPSHTAIGMVYARLVATIAQSEAEYSEAMYSVFTSDLSDAISNFNSALYFAPSDEIDYYYKTRYAH